MLLRICIDGIVYDYDLEAYGKNVITFGREALCDIVICKDYVSRRHGCFYISNGTWYVQDLGSTNGILMDNIRINEMPANGRTFVVRCGDNTMDQVAINCIEDGRGYVPNGMYGGMPDYGYSTPYHNGNDNNVTPGASVAGLVLGILSCVFCCCLYSLGLLAGIAGLICSICGNKVRKTGVGTAGMVTSIVGTSIAFIVFMYYLICGLTIYEFFNF